MRHVLAWWSFLGQYDWEKTKKICKIIFQSKVIEVYLILYDDLEEHLCNFWLQTKFETLFVPAQSYYPKENPHAKNCLIVCILVFASYHPPM